MQQVVQLVGPDALQDAERLTLEVGRIAREDFLQQNGFDPVDASCSMSKAYADRERKAKGHLSVVGGRKHNLKGITARIPLGLLTCVTGVSGSGKSTLVLEVLFHSLSQLLRQHPSPHSSPLKGRGKGEGKPKIDGCKELTGVDALDKVIDIDQSPIGRTPRSNPATYTGLFSFIRDLFSNLPESRVRGYKPGRYSFNVKGGRCEACQGDGLIKIEMHFLPDVYVTCEVCKGQRYNRETLEIQHKGRSIADILGMTVDDALEFFEHILTSRPNCRLSMTSACTM